MSPARTPAAYTAEPQPVGTPQPTSEPISNGMSSGSLMQAHSSTTAYWEKVPSVQKPPRSLAFVEAERTVGEHAGPGVLASSHMFWCPVEQDRHLPQAGM